MTACSASVAISYRHGEAPKELDLEGKVRLHIARVDNGTDTETLRGFNAMSTIIEAAARDESLRI